MSHTQTVFYSKVNRTENVRRMCGRLQRAGLLSVCESCLLSFFLDSHASPRSIRSIRQIGIQLKQHNNIHTPSLMHAHLATVALAMSAWGAAASKAHLVSFQGPFGSSGSIHGWKFMGSAVVTESYVRLTPAEVCAFVCVCVCVCVYTHTNTGSRRQKHAEKSTHVPHISPPFPLSFTRPSPGATF
jgi:hypothetical protein